MSALTDLLRTIVEDRVGSDHETIAAELRDMLGTYDAKCERITELEQGIADQKEYIEESAKIEMALRAENERQRQQIASLKESLRVERGGCRKL